MRREKEAECIWLKAADDDLASSICSYGLASNYILAPQVANQTVNNN